MGHDKYLFEALRHGITADAEGWLLRDLAELYSCGEIVPVAPRRWVVADTYEFEHLEEWIKNHENYLWIGPAPIGLHISPDKHEPGEAPEKIHLSETEADAMMCTGIKADGEAARYLMDWFKRDLLDITDIGHFVVSGTNGEALADALGRRFALSVSPTGYLVAEGDIW